jgi:hypothetical protein
LHQNREQYDWNQNFQPPSHEVPQDAIIVLPPALSLVENFATSPGNRIRQDFFGVG